MSETFLNGKITLFCGDSREVLKGIADNSIDSVVCDPPYALVSIVKRFGASGAPVKVPEGGSGAYARASAGFMGKQWDTGDTAFAVDFWAEVLRVLKPGGHVVAFSGTRTVHRLVCAIEDAGFEIRDQLQWIYGSGFPKSHDVSKGIDKAGPNYRSHKEFGVHYAERRIASGMSHAQVCALGGFFANVNHGGTSVNWETGRSLPTVAQWDVICPAMGLDEKWRAVVVREEYEREIVGSRSVNKGVAFTSEGPDKLDVTAPGCAASTAWQGWGTALKPAVEPICLARKPLISTVAGNVLAHGTGAINIDGCRVHADDAQGGEYTVTRLKPGATLDKTGGNWRPEEGGVLYHGEMKPGRWPANVLHDGSDEVLAAFPDAPGQQAAVTGDEPTANGFSGNVYGYGGISKRALSQPRGDSGSASRFFYTAKADADDRLGSKHPTVKPVDLMQWLCRLVTPPGGTVLDPFAGTGTTGEAAFREGFNAILIEREAEYQADIRRRMALVMSGPEERKRESIKAKLGHVPFEAGSLFDGIEVAS